MILTIPVLVINKKFFTSGFKGLIKRAANMDTLVALGSSASFLYGIFAIIMMIYGISRGYTEILEHYSHQLYFESSAMILTLVTLGKWLEEKSKRKTGDEIEKLIQLMSINPARRFCIPNENNFSVWKLDEEYKVNPEHFLSKGKSTPFENETVNGKCIMTVVDGKAVWFDKKYFGGNNG
jgi:Cu+-exporting ATPase